MKALTPFLNYPLALIVIKAGVIGSPGDKVCNLVTCYIPVKARRPDNRENVERRFRLREEVYYVKFFHAVSFKSLLC